ncbi:MAG: Fic family protein [Parachlamydiaceae bacterium]
MTWQPLYEMTPKVLHYLKRIEHTREQVSRLSIDQKQLNSLREMVRFCTVYHSTIIESYNFEPEQITKAISNSHSNLSDQAVNEIRGYYNALIKIEHWAASQTPITEKIIQTLHGTIISGGKPPIKPSPYRDRQNLIYNQRTCAIAYMPPPAEEVPDLMKQLVKWIQKSQGTPLPIVAAIVHHQFVTILPYYHANGRTARLLVSLILYLYNENLRGLFSLEKYYTNNLALYADAINISPVHNYFIGDLKTEVTPWIHYFLEVVAISFEETYLNLLKIQSQGVPEQATFLQKLDPKRRKALEAYLEFSTIQASQIPDS